MATCLKYQIISGSTAVVPDDATPISSCTLVALNASEYSQLSHGYIDNADDANAIVTAFVVLFAVVFGFKMIARALNVGDQVSDEKH
jgi:hypothetical protein